MADYAVVTLDLNIARDKDAHSEDNLLRRGIHCNGVTVLDMTVGVVFHLAIGETKAQIPVRRPIAFEIDGEAERRGVWVTNTPQGVGSFVDIMLHFGSGVVKTRAVT